MEKFLLRAKVTEWDRSTYDWTSRWAEGYLNLEGITEKGPVFTFVELTRGDCLYDMHGKNGDHYAYKPVVHSGFSKKTVSRWTGLLDKNGKKIWEGDIVKFHMFHDEPDCVGVVKYDTPICLYMLVGVMADGGPFEVQVSSVDKSTLEIIGNRWDNPELVKGE